MEKVALFGAAGAIGKSITAALRERGMAYRVVGRRREELQKTFGADPLAEIVTWNPDDPASVRAARMESIRSSIWSACRMTTSSCIQS
jgi:hypothetical protein